MRRSQYSFAQSAVPPGDDSRPNEADATDTARELAARLMLAQESERQRIAEGLHDDVGQSLATMKFKLARLRRASATDHARHELAELMDLVDAVIRRTRGLTFELSSPILHRLGLEAAVRNLLERVRDEHGLAVDVETEGDLGGLRERIAPSRATLSHRAIQELVRNVVRHSDASRVVVVLRGLADRIEITVADDGAGFDADGRRDVLRPDGGFGHYSIRRSLEHCGGDFAIESKPGDGCRATIVVPLEAVSGEDHPVASVEESAERTAAEVPES